jgi:ribosome-associated protein
MDAVETIYVAPPYIRLDAFLKFVGAAESGGAAKVMILDGDVRVNDAVCTERGRKIRANDRVDAGGRAFLVMFA